MWCSMYRNYVTHVLNTARQMVFQRFWAGWDLAYVQGAPASLVRLAEMDLDAEQSMRIYQAILEMQAAIGVWLERKAGPPPTKLQGVHGGRGP